jgi:hypothetical protein
MPGFHTPATQGTEIDICTCRVITNSNSFTDTSYANITNLVDSSCDHVFCIISATSTIKEKEAETVL